VNPLLLLNTSTTAIHRAFSADAFALVPRNTSLASCFRIVRGTCVDGNDASSSPLSQGRSIENGALDKPFVGYEIGPIPESKHAGFGLWFAPSSSSSAAAVAAALPDACGNYSDTERPVAYLEVDYRFSPQRRLTLTAFTYHTLQSLDIYANTTRITHTIPDYTSSLPTLSSLEDTFTFRKPLLIGNQQLRYRVNVNDFPIQRGDIFLSVHIVICYHHADQLDGDGDGSDGDGDTTPNFASGVGAGVKEKHA
jgi:hypothetical protein